MLDVDSVEKNNPLSVKLSFTMLFILSKVITIPLKYHKHSHTNVCLATLHQTSLNVQSATNTVSTLVHSKPNIYLQDARLKVPYTAITAGVSER